MTLKRFGQPEPTAGDKTKASTLAGGVAGTLGGMLSKCLQGRADQVVS
jgi:hypothetical protein